VKPGAMGGEGWPVWGGVREILNEVIGCIIL